MKSVVVETVLLSCVLVLSACGGEKDVVELNSENFAGTNEQQAFKMAISDELLQLRPQLNEQRNAYYGDLHVHTMYSFDAFIFGTTASPDQAYEFAKGETLRHPGGFDMQLQEPLDFYGVSDHAFYLGALRAMTDPSTELYKHELARGMQDLSDPQVRQQQFGRILSLIRSERSSELLDNQVFKSAWDDTIAAAPTTKPTLI